METKQYVDVCGTKWREVIYKDKTRLKQLKEMYDSKGHRTWIFPYDDSATGQERWILSIMFSRATA